jgi:amphi-Trp domain-containing protein
MGPEKKFSFESYQDRQTVQNYLRALLDGMESGRLVLTSGEQEMELSPAEVLKVKIKASDKGDGAKLSIKLSWKAEGEESAEETQSMTMQGS